jgi:hypothetical protein
VAVEDKPNLRAQLRVAVAVARADLLPESRAKAALPTALRVVEPDLMAEAEAAEAVQDRGHPDAHGRIAARAVVDQTA